MGAALAIERDERHPLDRVERLAITRSWSIDRPGDDEINMLVEGNWADLQITLNWRDDLESLHVVCMYGDKVPSSRREEIARLLLSANSQLFHGHFDLWPKDGSIVYRNSLVMAGGAEANDAQLEALIHVGLDTCQRYFPAIQFVVWAGKTAEEAIESSLFETMGEA